MDAWRDFTETLRGWTVEDLGGLLARRPWLSAGRAPRSLADAARALLSDTSTRLLLDAPLPLVQVLAEAVALVDASNDFDHDFAFFASGLPGLPALPPVTLERAALAARFAHAETAPDGTGFADVLRELERRALLVPVAGDRLAMPAVMMTLLDARGAYEEPSVFEALTREFAAPAVRRIAGTLGLPNGTRTVSDNEIALLLGEPGLVREIVAGAPAEARRMLQRLVDESSGLGTHCFQRDGARFVFRDGGSGDPDTDWLAARALIVPLDDDIAVVPKEVADALRGAAPLPELSLYPGALPSGALPPGEPAGQAQAAVLETLDRVGALLAELAGRPAAPRKSGGLAVRETARLAKALGAAEDEARLWIDLAAAAGLLAVSGAGLAPTAAADRWRAASPGERIAVLVAAWYRHELVITDWPREDDARSVALAAPDDPSAPAVRTALLEALATLPEGQGASTGLDTLLLAVIWFRPMAFASAHDVPPRLDATYGEARALGLVAANALTGPGRVLAERGPDEERIAAAVDAMLPPLQERAYFQADGIAVVPGPPAPRLAALLDAAAEREGRGGAAVWRFTDATIRAALDAGTSGEALLASLATASAVPLPQTLEYRIKDVAARHGRVKVVPVACCLRSDDEALLAELVAHRALASLRLRALAPTVLASAEPPAATLHALRAAGYAPAQEDGTGALAVERPAAPAAAPRRAGRRSPDPLELARRLLDG
ncbi:helicase-associated domain-containing protein [Actinomadura parmotrematis]|uniref:Helicase-associated domain-containing protein n=1 Tax=Actinomadura parmotrematis TaxID=2864039 RepID=A0ABS7FT06_9ACTN|nr:helicase-associated domain-containing protein [Actinomadura parmotrematis]MBW8483466.1 helicase-associated domain-containing protein [Actinomadura parmotrematis]